MVLYELHVEEAHRRRGIASSLIALVEQSCSSRGRCLPTIELNVHKHNSSAIAFYESIRFADASVAGRDSGDIVLMRRK